METYKFFLYAFLFFVVWRIGSAFYRLFVDGTQLHCMTCGSDTASVTRTKGSIWIEVILWLCLIVPGLIYSIWRLTTRHEACGQCGATNIVPQNAPAAVAHRHTMQAAKVP